MVETLIAICSVLQIVGLVLVVMWNRLPTFVGVIIGICGFAAAVKWFLPVPPSQGLLTSAAALAGVGVIAIACVFVHRRVEAHS